jgi:hypothetical protein
LPSYSRFGRLGVWLLIRGAREEQHEKGRRNKAGGSMS